MEIMQAPIAQYLLGSNVFVAVTAPIKASEIRKTHQSARGKARQAFFEHQLHVIAEHLQRKAIPIRFGSTALGKPVQFDRGCLGTQLRAAF